ncbi:hypothetical protein [Brevibacillus fulvus]|uniref:Uncharacterized protein n=1 Tax=Brevibacillus fulvus TaxID=1125967 RepID=A0A939BSP8_9BACL|nr:hypothetical protein [Brevibacillus fulvus]MBM7590957.1 hypothetical protein [Brevibacillus fulvus]
MFMMQADPEQFACEVASFHEEVERLARLFSLNIHTSDLSLQGQGRMRAQLEYMLWHEQGLVVVKGLLPLGNGAGEEPLSAFPATIRFSLTVEPGTDLESKRMRIEEYMGQEAELIWNVMPLGLNDHFEGTVHFLYQTHRDMLFEYAKMMMCIITGKTLAA